MFLFLYNYVHALIVVVLWHTSYYMYTCSTHHQRLVSQLILLQQCRPYDVKYIESDSHLSVYTMFVLGIINAMMNLFKPSS